tara:strand:+ start:378 stop:602 length:225 start_codon:yes stop_codon:yes gene_type:complete
MHSDDEKFVQKTILKLPSTATKQKAWAGYKAKYDVAFANEQVEHRKENKARTAANTALREYVDKVLEAYSEALK